MNYGQTVNAEGIERHVPYYYRYYDGDCKQYSFLDSKATVKSVPFFYCHVVGFLIRFKNIFIDYTKVYKKAIIKNFFHLIFDIVIL